MPKLRFRLLALLGFVAVGAGSWSLKELLLGLPPMQALEEYTPSQTTLVYDIKGNVVARLSIEQRALLPLSKIPVDMQNSVIAVEDDTFFRHWGVSPRGVLRSAVRNAIARRAVQGASTITQQLAKQIFLKPEKKLSRKIREVLLALQIERNFSKQEILQFYLNQVYFGEGAYGVQAAAHNYFGKEVSDLTLADAALLAGLIRAPHANSPFVNPENSRKRRAFVLQRMLDAGLITAAERDAADALPVPAARPAIVQTEAPYFVEHVRRRLEQKFGTRTLWRGGLKIYTTLDLDLEKRAEAIMAKSLDDFDAKAQQEQDKKIKDILASGEPLPPDVSTGPVTKIQGAFVLLDVKTGAVRAMIGGRDSKFNRITQAKRQPGSTFKPFVWAAALNSGLTAASLVDDSPLAYYYDGRDWRLLEGATTQALIELATATFVQNPEFQVWVPNDFDGKFYGRVTLRKALAFSRNLASVNLTTQVGPPLVVEIAHRAGVVSELAPVPALGLGASAVTPMEMTSAFGTFANGGIAVTPYTVERVEDSTGRVLEQHQASDREAISPQLAYLVVNLMKGVVQGGTGYYASRLARPLAGKTGTSNDNRDLWFIGYTPDVVAGAWMGYDDFASLGRKDWTGGTTVVPWWTEIMQDVLKDAPKRDFPVPPGIKFAAVDRQTGLLFGPDCPKANKLLEAFAAGNEPTRYCDLDHTQPIEPQLLTLPAVGPMGTVSTPGVSTAPAPGIPQVLPTAKGPQPLPLPSEDQLDGGKPQEQDSGGLE